MRFFDDFFEECKKVSEIFYVNISRTDTDRP